MTTPRTIKELREELPRWSIFSIDGFWPNEKLFLRHAACNFPSITEERYTGYGLREKRNAIARAYAAAKAFEGRNHG